jgi:hypothetical protein
LFFFIWVSVRYFDPIVLLIPVTVLVGAGIMLGLAKRYKVGEAGSESGTDQAAPPVEAVSSESASSVPAVKSVSRSEVGKFAAAAATSLISLIVLVASHIGGHDPHEHGNLPIRVQAVVALLGLSVSGWLAYNFLAEWIRLRRRSGQ